MIRSVVLFVFVFVGFCLLSSCGDDDVVFEFTGEEAEYALFEIGNSGVSGTARFKEREDGAVLVVLQTTGTASGDMHPAHIHANAASDGGSIVISLEPVSGDNGISETLITATDDGTPISYQELLEFDGHINIHESADNLSTVIAQGDLGPNVLTGEAEFYQLYDTDESGNSTAVATVSFKERMNGTALVEVDYTGSVAGNHPVHIHTGTAQPGDGPVAITLNEIGTSGRSATNINQTDAGDDLLYQDLVGYAGFMDIHSSSDNTVIASGDIGGNEFTSESIEYDLEEVNSSGVAGIATFYERNNGSFMVVLEMAGTISGSSHPAHIHHNSAADGGGIAASLNDVVNGLSITEISEMDNGTPLTYEEVLGFNGHINVHLSSAEMSVLVAQGDIGAND